MTRRIKENSIKAFIYAVLFIAMIFKAYLSESPVAPTDSRSNVKFVTVPFIHTR